MNGKEQSVPVLQIYIPTAWQINHIFSQIKEMLIIFYVSVHNRSASHTSITPCCKNHVETNSDGKDSRISDELPASTELAKIWKLYKSYKRCLPPPRLKRSL